MKSLQRICLVDTPYSLLVYLTACTESEIKATFFVLGENISSEIAQNLSYSYRVPYLHSWLWRRSTRWIAYRILKCLYLPSITARTEIFAHDHLSISPVIIGSRNYTMIEDSPLICSNYFKSPAHERDNLNRKTIKTAIYRLLYGRLVNASFANNDQCKAILMTEEDDADYIKSKKHYIINLTQLWARATENKRDLIKKVFGLNPLDVELLHSHTDVLFTQPLTDVLTIEEQENIYREIAKQYSPKSLVIKVHPRDVVCYERILPEYAVFRKKVPSQLLDLVGVRHERAITLFSSAVANFSYPIKIDWYGTEVHDKLLKHYGNVLRVNLT